MFLARVKVRIKENKEIQGIKERKKKGIAIEKT